MAKFYGSLQSIILDLFQISGLKGGGMKDERQEEGVPDMTVMSDINETGINNNLQIRYKNDNIYVS